MRGLWVGWLMGGLCLTAAATKIGPWTPEEFADRVNRLNRAYDRIAVDRKVPLSAEAETELFRKADAVCDGMAFFFKQEAVKIGTRNIDWFGGQKAHQEWVAQLNRFFMLDFLCNAYRRNQAEKYAARARELMEDWFDFWRRHDERFIDPQRNNELNCSIRLRNWTTALAVFRNSAAFDDAFVERALGVITRQANRLLERTSPGDSNWQIAQAFALLEVGSALSFLPDASRWREKGRAVLNECFSRQFRKDGSHVENTTGYHQWMLKMLLDAVQVCRIQDEPLSAVNPEIIAGALDFSCLSQSFAFNDSSYGKAFPRLEKPLDLTRAAKRGGVPDWRPKPFGVFRDAGLVFGGNEQERFFFDAGPYVGWHTHMSRLSFEYAAYGYSLLVDPAVTTYERKEPHYACGRATYSHATVNFNGAHQARTNAALLDADLGKDFGVAVGEFNGGAFQGPFADRYEPNLKAAMRRAILWLEGVGLLILDRTAVQESPDGKAVTRYVFPAAPMEKWYLDTQKLCWRSDNGKMPNLLIQMVLKPVDQVGAICSEGVREPEWRGWNGSFQGGPLMASPTVEFAADTGFAESHAVTYLAAAPAGRVLAPVGVVQAAPGTVDFRTDDGVLQQLRYQTDLRTPGHLTAGVVAAEAVLLWRRGDDIWVYRAASLSREGKQIPLPRPGFTGWIRGGAR